MVRSKQAETLEGRANAGDEGAAADLIAEHLPYWMAAARGIVGETAGNGTEDLVQQALARLWELWREGKGPTSNTRAYVTAMMRNAFRDHLRSPRAREQSIDVYEEFTGNPLLSDDDDLTVIDLHREREIVARAFATLSDDYQTVLRGVVIEGRKPTDLTDELHRPARAISDVLLRAKHALRRAVLIDHLSQGDAECRANAQLLPQRVHTQSADHPATDRGVDHVYGCDHCRRNWRAFAAVATAFGVVPLLVVGELVRGAAPAAAAGLVTGTADTGTADDINAAGSDGHVNGDAMTTASAAAGVAGFAGGMAATGAAAGTAKASRAATTSVSAPTAPTPQAHPPGAAPSTSAASASSATAAGGIAAALSGGVVLAAGIVLVLGAAAAFISHGVITSQIPETVAIEAPEVTLTNRGPTDIALTDRAGISIDADDATFAVDMAVEADHLQSITIDFAVHRDTLWDVTELAVQLPGHVTFETATNGLECASDGGAVLCVATASSAEQQPFELIVTSAEAHGEFTLLLGAEADGETYTGTARGYW